MQEEVKEYTRSDLQFAQYAGLFDGEGSIGMYAKTDVPRNGVKYSVTLRVSMINRETLARMYSHFGAGTLKKYGPRPRRQPYWCWFCGKRTEVIRILRRLIPHLDLKANEAKLALDYLLTPGLTIQQQDRYSEAMRLPKCRQRTIVANQYGRGTIRPLSARYTSSVSLRNGQR
jgi:hypothetical protein